MKSLLAFMAGLFCLVSSSFVYAEGGYLVLELGNGEINIDDPDRLPFTPIGDVSSDGGLSSAVGGGYEFANKVHVDVTYFEIDTVSLFGISDVFDLRSIRIGVGYAMPASDNFSFLARTGVALWDLDTTESAFLNPGPEASTDFDGADLFFEVGARWHINDKWRLSLVHTFDTHDLGDASSTRLGLQFFWAPK